MTRSGKSCVSCDGYRLKYPVTLSLFDAAYSLQRIHFFGIDNARGHPAPRQDRQSLQAHLSTIESGKIAESYCPSAYLLTPKQESDAKLISARAAALQQRGNLSEPVQPASSENIEERVLRVIATTRRVPLDTIRAASTFEELGIDSLDRINILFELEGEFDIEIDDEQAKQVTTLQQMIDGIALLLAAKAAGASS